jgi:Fe-S cluster protector protein
LIGDIARGQTTKWNRNGSWVEYEDVLQEAWVAYLTHKTLIDEYLATSRRTEARYLIRDHVYRFCRKEKARRSGYDPEDEHLYTLKALRALLPGAFGGDVASEGGSSLEPRKGRGGGGTGSDLDTSLIDVRWGLERVDGYDREMLFWASTGGGWEQPPARAALRRLQTVLGGAPG